MADKEQIQQNQAILDFLRSMERKGETPNAVSVEVKVGDILSKAKIGEGVAVVIPGSNLEVPSPDHQIPGVNASIFEHLADNPSALLELQKRWSDAYANFGPDQGSTLLNKAGKILQVPTEGLQADFPDLLLPAVTVEHIKDGSVSGHINERVLKNVVCDILLRASNLGIQKVAFPAIGTNRLGMNFLKFPAAFQAGIDMYERERNGENPPVAVQLVLLPSDVERAMQQQQEDIEFNKNKKVKTSQSENNVTQFLRRLSKLNPFSRE